MLDIISRAGQNYQNGHLHKGAKPVHCVLTAVPRWRKRKLNITTKRHRRSTWRSAPSIRCGESEVWSAGRERPQSLVIWTTTPWTLPHNRAISLGRFDFDYALVQIDGQVILAKDLVESVMQRIGAAFEYNHSRHR
ncbi:class I tRNA ligase family protein [Salmonella enterica subsp. enterica]|nr:class I tRNA ligase family protein [Salmonella enterica subsp. enterica]